MAIHHHHHRRPYPRQRNDLTLLVAAAIAAATTVLCVFPALVSSSSSHGREEQLLIQQQRQVLVDAADTDGFAASDFRHQGEASDDEEDDEEYDDDDVNYSEEYLPQEEVLYQDAKGHLCMDGVCWDPYDQGGILTHQLWYFRHRPLVGCRDLLEDCSARKSECDGDDEDDASEDVPSFVRAYCPRTCNACQNRTRTSSESLEKKPIRIMSERGVILDAIGSDIGVPQIVRGTPEHQQQIRDVVDEARLYITDTVNFYDRYLTVRTKCRNLHEDCASWAALGECDNNFDFVSSYFFACTTTTPGRLFSCSGRHKLTELLNSFF